MYITFKTNIVVIDLMLHSASMGRMCGRQTDGTLQRLAVKRGMWVRTIVAGGTGGLTLLGTRCLAFAEVLVERLV